jgi:hypothetical protein
VGCGEGEIYGPGQDVVSEGYSTTACLAKPLPVKTKLLEVGEGIVARFLNKKGALAEVESQESRAGQPICFLESTGRFWRDRLVPLLRKYRAWMSMGNAARISSSRVLHRPGAVEDSGATEASSFARGVHWEVSVVTWSKACGWTDSFGYSFDALSFRVEGSTGTFSSSRPFVKEAMRASCDAVGWRGVEGDNSFLLSEEVCSGRRVEVCSMRGVTLIEVVEAERVARGEDSGISASKQSRTLSTYSHPLRKIHVIHRCGISSIICTHSLNDLFHLCLVQLFLGVQLSVHHDLVEECSGVEARLIVGPIPTVIGWICRGKVCVVGIIEVS